MESITKDLQSLKNMDGSAPKEPKNVFGSKAGGKKDPLVPDVIISNEVKTMTRNLRILEERHNNLRRKSQVIEQNMLANHKRSSSKLKDVDQEIRELRNSIERIDEKLTIIMNYLEGCAKKNDVKVIEKYLDMWNPSSFVTRAEIPKIMGSVVNEIRDKGKEAK